MIPCRVILAIDAISPPLTGIGRYTLALAKGLAQHPEIDRLRLLDRLRWRSAAEILNTPDKVVPGGVPATRHPLRRELGRRLLPILRYGQLRPYQDHLFHSPNYALPPFSGKSVSTLHDLSVLRHPEFHPEERVRHLKRLFPVILKRADLLITDSEFSRWEILEVLGVAPDRVRAIPLGVDPSYRPRPPDEIQALMTLYGLRAGAYTLSVGTIEPRKNLLRLIEAYARLPQALRRAIPLVLAGSPGWRSEAIHERIESGVAEGWLHYLRYVAEADLPGLYAGARLFACVSLYEGFGLPPLEAMACGIPVIAAQAASLPEVVGSAAAALINPLETEAIRAALEELLEDDRKLQEARDLGLSQAAAFTWERTVAETLRAYQSLL